MVMNRTYKTAAGGGGWHTDSVLRDGGRVNTQQGDNEQEWDHHWRAPETWAPGVL